MISTNRKGLIDHLLKDQEFFRICLILFLRMGTQWPYGPGEACQGFAKNKEVDLGENKQEMSLPPQKKRLKNF